jgi:glycosyltransferase involved in cell wall biosynthesis
VQKNQGQETYKMESEINPLISVIIPHLNQNIELERCLESIHNQTFDNGSVEVIVIDNGSRTMPRKTCASFKAVRLAKEVISGPGPARNKGVALSRGQILAFIDADCIADSRWLGAIAREVRNGGRYIIGGDVRIAICNPQRPTALEAYESIFSYRQKEYIERHSFSGTGNLAMLRSIYDAIGPFSGPEIAEDRDWGRRAKRKGFSIDYVPDMIVCHPARQSFAELSVKWDRHISHEFSEIAHGLRGRLFWIIRALAVGMSPIVEVRRILTSRRVSTTREKCMAMLVLIRIRLYRAGQMLNRLLNRMPTEMSAGWNR